MTGIQAPFEEPDSPDMVIDTDRLTVDQSVSVLVDLLSDHGIISGAAPAKPQRKA